MAKKNGWIKIHHHFFQSQFWITASPAKRSIILTCLALADHGDFTFKTSSRELAKECRVRRTTLREYLKELVSDHFISVKSAHHETVITVLHYNTLHEFEKGVPPTSKEQKAPTLGSQMTHIGFPNDPHRVPNQPTHINNKEKNEKKKDFATQVLTEKDLSLDEVPFLRSLYPFHTSKENLIQHLKNRMFSEHAISELLEKVIYPNEYGYRRVNT